jgi:hypothetical protein
MVRYSGGGVACDFEGRDQESIQDILAVDVEKGRSECLQAFVDERRTVGCVTFKPFQAALLCDALALAMFLSGPLYLLNLPRMAKLL